MDTSILSTADPIAASLVNTREGLPVHVQAGGRGGAGASRYEAIARGQGGTETGSPVGGEARPTARPQTSQQIPGRIRFVTLEGVQATQYFDSKDILIYQVPSPGQIHLIKVKESNDQSQVEAQA